MTRFALLVPAWLVVLALPGCDHAVTPAQSKKAVENGGGGAAPDGSSVDGKPCKTEMDTVACANGAVATCIWIDGSPPDTYFWSNCTVPDCSKGQTEICPGPNHYQVQCAPNDIGHWMFNCPA